MSMLELGGRRFTIPMGEVVLGSDPQCAISLTGAGLLPRHALLVGQPDGQVVIRKAAPEAEVMINGVRLGAEPTPLLHGDKLQVAGQELTFVDERRSGSTQFVPAMGGALGADARPQTGKSVGTTGGRLVSLTDGREYVIMASSLVMGREAGCDVVVPGKDVSRRHAEIVPSPKGYLLVDSSTNGVYVNDARVQGQRVLTRGDVIRIGEESFRFYADQAAATPAPTPPPAPAPPPPGAESRLQNTSFGMPVTPRPAAAPANPAGTRSAPLANFLVRGGALKGTRLLIKTPIANIGRADYNDLVIPDESVSTSHAKLQRREGVWVLVDLESTNGTFVDGERIKADTPIAPGTMVRFGDIQLVFEPTDDALGVAKGGGTKVIESLRVPAAAAAEAATPTVPPQPPPTPRPAAKPSPAPAPAPAAKPAAAPKGPPSKPAPARRPGPPAGQAPQKKGKGCGSSAAVLVLATTALLYWILA
jgi:pSer/pThr/pTyr-binding forkhead associated (FHA) protein